MAGWVEPPPWFGYNWAWWPDILVADVSVPSINICYFNINSDGILAIAKEILQNERHHMLEKLGVPFNRVG